MYFVQLGGKYKWHILLLASALVAFWPLSTFQYIPKWDNIDCYLPYRYFVNWSYQNGEWPLWNPFQHFGYPAYSDMQNGMYNPIVWIIHLFGNYDASSLTVELLFYYLIGILGAYKLASLFVNENASKLLIALSFGLSGFMISTSQIMIFIAGAAFLPHILFHFHQLLFDHNLKNYLWFAIYVVLHTTSASPAFTIVLIYVLSILFAVFLIKRNEFSNAAFFRKNGLKLIVIGVLIVGMLLPFIVALYEFLPYFHRAEKLPYSNFLLENPFDYQEYLSFLFPYTTLGNTNFFGNTDLTMRSAYIGFFPFLCFLLSLRYINEKYIKWLWFSLIIFLLIAAGGTTPFYKLVYELPGFGLFRHPSIFRVYIVLIITILAGIGFERWNTLSHPIRVKRTLWFICSILTLITLVSFAKSYPEELSRFFDVFNPNIHFPSLSMRTFLFYNALFLLLLTIIALLAYQKVKHFKALVLVLLFLDVFTYSQVSSSYTIHYPIKNQTYESYFNKLPNDANQTLNTLPYKNLIENYEPKLEGLWRNTSTFHKKISFDGHNQTQFSKFNQIEKNGNIAFAKENSLFYELSAIQDSLIPKANTAWNVKKEKLKINPDTTLIQSAQVGFNSFSVRVKNESTETDWVVLNQNFHHLWTAKLNGKKIPIYLINEAFMGIEIPSKTSGELAFTFNSPSLKYAVLIAVLCYLIVLSGLGYLNFRKQKFT